MKFSILAKAPSSRGRKTNYDLALQKSGTFKFAKPVFDALQFNIGESGNAIAVGTSESGVPLIIVVSKSDPRAMYMKGRGENFKTSQTFNSPEFVQAIQAHFGLGDDDLGDARLSYGLQLVETDGERVYRVVQWSGESEFFESSEASTETSVPQTPEVQTEEEVDEEEVTDEELEQAAEDEDDDEVDVDDLFGDD